MSLEEVALKAKVSTATVSRVLNGVGGVRNTTRARVLSAAEELRYYPNLHARTLAGGRSHTLGMIVSNLENPFFLDIFKSAEFYARSRGYDIFLANTDYQPEILVKNIRLMIGRRVAGLALVTSEVHSNLTHELMQLKIPVVLYDVGEPKHNIVKIAVNYASGIERMVDYLHRLGHQRIAFVGHHPSLSPLGVREQAFRKAVEKYTPHVQWRIVANADTLEGGGIAAREVLSSGLNPTAIICINDLTALGVLYALRQAGIKVPEQISVSGFDDIKLAEIANPSLTTLHIPRAKIGTLMAEALIGGGVTNAHQTVAHQTIARQIDIEPELALRESTGPAAPER